MIDPATWQPADGLDLESTAEHVVKSRRNILVIAGPGAGKTELLAQRACYLLETGICPDPARILAVSFKRDAAWHLKDRVIKRAGRELSNRFDSLTFDAFAKGLLDRFIRLLPTDIRPTLDYRIDHLTDRELDNELRGLSGSHPLLTSRAVASIRPSEFRFQYLHGSISSWRNHPEENVNTIAASFLWRKLLKSQQQSSISFAMIGRLVAWLVGNDSRLRKILSWSYPFVFLDEFQDTTGTQYEVLSNIFKDSQRCLTAVGDHKQRIMIWAGAHRRVFDVYNEDFSAKTERLRRNYRCAKKIIKLIDYIGSIIDSENIAAEPMRDEDGEVQILSFPNENIEADELADRIEDWRCSGVQLQKIVIITRNRSPQYTEPLSESLKEKNIQCRDDAKVQDMIGSSLSSFFINMLRVATKKRQPDTWNELIFIKEQALGHEVDNISLSSELNFFLRKFKSRLRECQVDEAHIADLMWHSLEWTGRDYFMGFHPEYRRDGELDREIKITSNLLSSFLENRSWGEVIDYIDGTGCIRFMTIHKSKGLEFERVIFLGLEDSAFWNIANNEDEEVCNFFVALSRARDGVYFTTCKNRVAGPTSYGQGRQSTENINSLFDALRAIGVTEMEY